MSNTSPLLRLRAALGTACLTLAACGTSPPATSPDAATADVPTTDMSPADIAAELGPDAPAPDAPPADMASPDATADASLDAPDARDVLPPQDLPDAPSSADAPDVADRIDTADAPDPLDALDAADAPDAATIDATDEGVAEVGADASSADAPDVTDVADVADVVDARTCDAGLSACGGACVVTATDRAHCGRCDNACAAGSACVAGACVVDRCVGVTCAPADPCHAPNTCDRATGLCAGDPLRVTVSAAATSTLTGTRGCSPGATGTGCLFQSYDVAGNFAAQANNGGRAAVTSGVIPGFPTIHSPGGLNDGRYGNGASWVAAATTSWFKVDLGRSIAIDRITFGRDRVGGGGDGRVPGRYTVRVAATEAAYAEGNADNDAVEYRRVFDSTVVGGRGESNLLGDTLEARFPPVVGRYVKVEFVSPTFGVGIDEVQVYGCDPATSSCPSLPSNDGAACEDGLRTTLNDQCAGGACVGTACAPGLADCDRAAANGCEVDTTTNRNCGGCGVVCGAGQQCVASACVAGVRGAVAFVPGPGRLEVYSPTANTVRVTLGTTALPALVFTAPGVRSAALTTADVLRLDSDDPFVAWVHDNGNTDQAEAASAVDGSLLANELYTWAGSAVTVFAGSTAPSSVRVFDLAATPPTEVAAWTSPTAGAFRALRVPRASLYRIVAVGGAVTAFGQSLAETYNHAAFVPADDGNLRGTSFRYAEPAGAPGVRRLVVQSLSASTMVNFRVGTVDTPRTLAAAFDTTSIVFPADTLAAVTSAAPAIAWIEADPGNGACDGSLSDADLVPSLRGALVDTEFRVRSTLGAADCYTPRRGDFDVLAYSAGTEVMAYNGATATPFLTGTLGRGQRLRVVTDAVAGRDVRVVTSRPASLERSHADFDFLLRVASSVTAP